MVMKRGGGFFQKTKQLLRTSAAVRGLDLFYHKLLGHLGEKSIIINFEGVFGGGGGRVLLGFIHGSMKS